MYNPKTYTKLVWSSFGRPSIMGPNMARFPMSQRGPKGSKWFQMITCFWSFGTIFGPFEILRIISEKKTWYCASKTQSASWPKWFGEKNQVLSEMVLKFPNGPKMFPNGQKHVMLIIWYNFFIPLWDNGKHAMFGHFWSWKTPPPANMIEGWQWPKLLQTNLVYV